MIISSTNLLLKLIKWDNYNTKFNKQLSLLQMEVGSISHTEQDMKIESMFRCYWNHDENGR